jgi:hypothetical protein
LKAKKLFVVIISIFLGIILLIGIGVAILARTGNGLDRESKAYVDAAVPAIVSSWSEDELMNRATSEMRQATKPADTARMFAWFKTLGRLQKYEGSQGQATISVTNETGRVVSAHYQARAIFDRGEATINVGLIKSGNIWQIVRFQINSAALPLSQRR